MKQILPICCFCEKIRDDTGTEAGKGRWQEFRIYMVAHKLKPEDIAFSHTYCHICLEHDRVRSLFSHSPVRQAHPRMTRLVKWDDPPQRTGAMDSQHDPTGTSK